jgi:TonB family protein
MTLYGLRLLVALLTFAVGIAAAWLFNFQLPRRSQVVVSKIDHNRVHVAQSRDEPQRSCSIDKPRSIEGGILNNKSVSKPAPVYPLDARAARVEGTVAVRVVVDEGGKVSSAEAVSGSGLLREAAVEAALSACFSPTLLSGHPVKVSGTITYNFVLD